VRKHAFYAESAPFDLPVDGTFLIWPAHPAEPALLRALLKNFQGPRGGGRPPHGEISCSCKPTSPLND